MSGAYMTHLPLKFMRVMAGFNESGGDYFLGRAQLDPPQALLIQIFPWLEQWELRFRRVTKQKNLSFEEGGLEYDVAGSNFIKLLKHLRTVLLQDLAVFQPGQLSFLSSGVAVIFVLSRVL